jgi:hypothetical protein
LVHSVGEQQSEPSPSDAVVNSVVMDGAAVLHQALAGETFLEKERRLSEMIRQLQMLREQLLSQQELQTKVGAARLHVAVATDLCTFENLTAGSLTNNSHKYVLVYYAYTSCITIIIIIIIITYN